jgi:hypothetical protein
MWKANGKTTTLSLFLDSLVLQRYHVYEMLGDRRGYSHLKEEALSIALSGGIVLEEAVDLSSDRLLMMM